MSKTSPILLIAALGAGAFILMSRKKATPKEEKVPEEQKPGVGGATIDPGAIKDWGKSPKEGPGEISGGKCPPGHTEAQGGGCVPLWNDFAQDSFIELMGQQDKNEIFAACSDNDAKRKFVFDFLTEIYGQPMPEPQINQQSGEYIEGSDENMVYLWKQARHLFDVKAQCIGF